MTTLAAFADEIEALTADYEARLAALAVCTKVISHPDTHPRMAGRVWLLQQWLSRDGWTR